MVLAGDINGKMVTQMFLHWNQIRASLEQWKYVLQPEASTSSVVTTIVY